MWRRCTTNCSPVHSQALRVPVTVERHLRHPLAASLCHVSVRVPPSTWRRPSNTTNTAGYSYCWLSKTTMITIEYGILLAGMTLTPCEAALSVTLSWSSASGSWSPAGAPGAAPGVPGGAPGRAPGAPGSLEASSSLWSRGASAEAPPAQ